MAAKKPLVLDSSANLQQMQSGDFIDVTQGGTGSTSAAGALANLGAYPASNPNNYINAAGAPVQSVAGRTGAVVLSQSDIAGLLTSSSPTFAAVTAVTFTGALAGNANTATSLAGGVAGAIHYQSGAGVSAFSTAGTAGQLMVSGGAGAPTWINQNGITLQSSQVTAALGFTPVNPNTLGAASGIATLDATGKLTLAQIPAALVGAMQYQGVWNASTNSPALASGVGTKGQYYKVSVAGATTIDGINQWNVGDMIAYDGTTWDKIDGLGSEVTSVAGRVGAVTLTQADIAGLLTTSSPTFAAVTAVTFTGALAGNATTATTAGNVSGIVAVANGGTGANNAAGALTNLGAYPASNPNNYINAAGAPVQSVAGRTGAVTLSQADIAGLTTASSPTFAAVNAAALNGNATSATSGVSSLVNDEATSTPIGSPVYLDASGGFVKAKADLITTSDVFGLLTANVANGVAGNVAHDGEVVASVAQWNAIVGGTTGLTPGATYYLSNATAGMMTTVVPTSGFICRLGKAISTTRFVVNVAPRIQL